MSDDTEATDVEKASVVTVHLKADGTFDVASQAIDNFTIPTLLRLAAKAVEKELGL